MEISLRHKKFEKIIGFIAFLLAIFAALLGEPYKVSEQKSKMVKPLEIKEIKIDYIESSQLAEWLMEKKADLIVFDVRTVAEFNDYHIPSARDITILENHVETIPLDQTIVIYSENNVSAIERWLELKHYGYEKVYLLEGGIRSWVEEILFPDLSNQSGLGEAAIEKINKTSLYFGGKPKIDEFYKNKSRKKYHREGC
jgi:rhodanese-related sulfurtransferase